MMRWGIQHPSLSHQQPPLRSRRHRIGRTRRRSAPALSGTHLGICRQFQPLSLEKEGDISVTYEIFRRTKIYWHVIQFIVKTTPACRTVTAPELNFLSASAAASLCPSAYF